MTALPRRHGPRRRGHRARSAATRGLILTTISIIGATPAAAHHGTSTFDGNTVVAIEGTVLENRWTNPHGTVILETRNADGNTRELAFEADGPSLLGPMGVTRDSLRAGDRVVMYASPSNIGKSNEYLAREALKEDGSVVRLSVRYARERARGSLPRADSVIGIWVPDRSALFDFVGWRGSWELTAAGLEGEARYDVFAAFAHAECIPATAPIVMVYPTAKVLENRGDHIWLNADWMGATRTIYMDGRAPTENSLQGHSVGRWDGEALVIETTHFSDNEIGNAFGVPSGQDKRIVERLMLAPDGMSLTYSFELEDPEFLAEPVSNGFTWHYRPDVSASPVECDLDAASQYLNE
jgi:hypothetical protein